jgi:hypothetical protein
MEALFMAAADEGGQDGATGDSSGNPAGIGCSGGDEPSSGASKRDNGGGGSSKRGSRGARRGRSANRGKCAAASSSASTGRTAAYRSRGSGGDDARTPNARAAASIGDGGGGDGARNVSGSSSGIGGGGARNVSGSSGGLGRNAMPPGWPGPDEVRGAAAGWGMPGPPGHRRDSGLPWSSPFPNAAPGLSQARHGSAQHDVTPLWARRIYANNGNQGVNFMAAFRGVMNVNTTGIPTVPKKEEEAARPRW